MCGEFDVFGTRVFIDGLSNSGRYTCGVWLDEAECKFRSNANVSGVWDMPR